MLTGLSIRDFVLIDRLDLEFASGLTVLTGETGTGKSILLDAMGLAIGARADSSLVRSGAQAASVVAAFAVASDHPARDILRVHDVHDGDDIVLRRTISADGGSRAFVNDRPATATLLRSLGDALVEVQGQSEHRALVDPDSHRRLLDSFGRLSSHCDTVGEAWHMWREAIASETEAVAEYDKARADEDYLRHAVAELIALRPQQSEEAELAERRSTLMNRDKLIDGLNAAVSELGGENDVESRLRTALARIENIAPLAGSLLDDARAALDRAIAETAEAGAALGSAGHDIDLDDDRLEEIEERLFRLRDVARKHGAEVADLPELIEEFQRRLALIEDRDDARARLQRETELARERYLVAARQLNEARTKAARRLDRSMAVELPPLHLDKAVFETRIDARPEDDWGPSGTDRVRFLIATVPGKDPGPLSKVASGGELSRLMLALRVVLAGSGVAPALVFDEVDSGVGGATAAAVGERLSRLSTGYQVLVVTHSPQVAARGDQHLRVEKSAAKGTLHTRVEAVAAQERQEEIARMLSGRRVTAAARAAAASLLHGDAA
ncbi:MAG: DNA repair protein RecN [Alphaproteobacteria bacterium]|nr:DNA repair protein RecN [Alphaproteobacteria bacterium]